MLPICISDDLLNMCSEPFVMAPDVRAACIAYAVVKSVASFYEPLNRTVDQHQLSFFKNSMFF